MAAAGRHGARSGGAWRSYGNAPKRQAGRTVGRALEHHVELRYVVLHQLYLVVAHHCAGGAAQSALVAAPRAPPPMPPARPPPLSSPSRPPGCRRHHSLSFMTSCSRLHKGAGAGWVSGRGRVERHGGPGRLGRLLNALYLTCVTGRMLPPWERAPGGKTCAGTGGGAEGGPQGAVTGDRVRRASHWQGELPSTCPLGNCRLMQTPRGHELQLAWFRLHWPTAPSTQHIDRSGWEARAAQWFC